MRGRAGLTALVVGALCLTACSGGDAEDVTPSGAGGTAGATSGSTSSPGGGSPTSGQPSSQPVTGGQAETADAPKPALEVTLTATGDILAHSRVNVTANRYAGGGEGAYDYSPMFADVAPLISEADLALCHLETPLSADNTNLSQPDILVFNTPHQMADALAAAGYDGCDFASNHTMDQGLSGLAATEQVLRDAGMGYAGPTAHEDEAGLAEVYEVDTQTGPARIAHLAYTYTYPNSGQPTTDIPGDAPWLVEASWPNLGGKGILEQAQQAREDGADFVVLSMHWGNEYQAEPTEQQRQLARDLLTSGDVDLILGTHVHVIQPCEQIDGRHVIYGMGNFLSNQSPDASASLLPATQEGMVARFTLNRDAEGEITTSMRYQPTRVEIDAAALRAGSTGPHIIRLVSPETYPQTWERTTSTVDLLGGCGAEAVHP